ncbi:MAG TPA: invasion associated locus B family protein [Stellaceae bacterium]|nr:invasion associated locus B family protein [Stellaceae bacterium]
MFRSTGSWMLSLLLLALPAHAQSAKKTAPAKHPVATTSPTRRLGVADGWSAFTYREKSGQVCYLAADPRKTEPASMKRKPATAMVTHRPEEHVANVVSFVEGYPLKEGSDASLDIDGAKYDLFTKGDTAWSRTADTDKTIVEAMAKGKQAVIKATPQKGTQTSDTYSLAGFGKALALIDKACGVKR